MPATFDPPPPNTITPYRVFTVRKTETYTLWATDEIAASALADMTDYSELQPDTEEIEVELCH